MAPLCAKRRTLARIARHYGQHPEWTRLNVQRNDGAEADRGAQLHEPAIVFRRNAHATRGTRIDSGCVGRRVADTGGTNRRALVIGRKTGFFPLHLLFSAIARIQPARGCYVPSDEAPLSTLTRFSARRTKQT